jgi:cell wall-associated NlpC family hydrolase
VSDDLTEFTMSRRQDGVSTFNFTIQNTRRKYDGIFAPNDRVSVMMKRLTWVRTFTGYLNSVPLATAWPQAVPLSSSCSLKRLQYWYWDSYVEFSQQLVQKALAAHAPDGSSAATSDGNITNVVLAILRDVVGWPESKVHIARIPQEWFKIALKIAQQVEASAAEADKIAEQIYSTVGGGGSIGGVSATAGGTLKPGSYGGYKLDQDQCNNAVAVFKGGVAEAMSVRDIAIGIMTAMTESSLHNIAYGDAAGPDSRGLFQQRAPWGDLSVRMDPVGSSRLFFRALKKKVPNRNDISPWVAAQRVQVSAFSDGSNYRKYWALGQAAAQAIANSAAKPATVTASLPGTHIDPITGKRVSGPASSTAASPSSGGVTNRDYLGVALKLVSDHPNIAYSQENSSASSPSNPNPTRLDCSSFTRWVYAHTIGTVGDMPRTATAQYYWAAKYGRKLSVAQAMRTPGACVYILGEHVEVTLGDGKRTVGAHTYGTPAKVVDWGSTPWNAAAILPRLTPVNIGAGGGATSGGSDPSTGGSGGTQISTYNQAPGYDPNDPFDKLFGSAPWVPIPSLDANATMANALGGVRSLLNDTPLLPYIKNLFNATMRAFCSAPNGDLIAWFPDYYGIWGTAAKMVIEPIELKNFTVEWSDDFFVTHQFASAGVGASENSGAPAQVDVGTGNVTPAPTAPRQVFTRGIATIEMPALLYAILGVDTKPGDAANFARWVLKRFGARPDYQPMETLIGLRAEFFIALFLFMRNWAYQYNADVPMTFMPELWPGMLIQVPAFDFQAYVTTVTHSGKLGEGGGFSTTANISSPARLQKAKGDHTNVLMGLPLAGGYNPGHAIGDVPDYLVGSNDPVLSQQRAQQIQQQQAQNKAKALDRQLNGP